MCRFLQVQFTFDHLFAVCMDCVDPGAFHINTTCTFNHTTNLTEDNFKSFNFQWCYYFWFMCKQADHHSDNDRTVWTTVRVWRCSASLSRFVKTLSITRYLPSTFQLRLHESSTTPYPFYTLLSTLYYVTSCNSQIEGVKPACLLIFVTMWVQVCNTYFVFVNLCHRSGHFYLSIFSW